VRGLVREHTADGHVVLEANFPCDLFDSFNAAYHFAGWAGCPVKPPALMSFAHAGGSLKTYPSSGLYVSKNKVHGGEVIATQEQDSATSG
jgi:hypothetical protein